MGYIVIIVACIFVLADARKRKAKALRWVIGTAFLSPIVIPLYLAQRPLKAGEIREGGTGWNVARFFAFYWTTLMVTVAIDYSFRLSNQGQSLQGQAQQVGYTIGATIGFGMLFLLWFLPLMGAFVIGLFLRKASVIERGPTGPLMDVEGSR